MRKQWWRGSKTDMFNKFCYPKCSELYMTAKIGRFAPSFAGFSNFALMAFTVWGTSVSVFGMMYRLSFFECEIFVFSPCLSFLNFFALCSRSANALHSPGTSRPGPYDRFFEKKRRKKLLFSDFTLRCPGMLHR